MKRFFIKTGIVVAIFALFFGMFYLRPSRSHPPEPPRLSDSATTSVASAEPDDAPPIKPIKPVKPFPATAQAKTGTQTVYRYTPPFRPPEKIPKALRGNLHAQQLLIVLEEAEVNPAIIQFEFKNIYMGLGAIKYWRYQQASEFTANYEKLAEIINKAGKDPDALEKALRMRDGDDYFSPISFNHFMEERREQILTALAGTKIITDPTLQEKLFSIQPQLELSTEATEFMKSYSPTP
jgi:hypothetical protein